MLKRTVIILFTSLITKYFQQLINEHLRQQCYIYDYPNTHVTKPAKYVNIVVTNLPILSRNLWLNLGLLNEK